MGTLRISRCQGTGTLGLAGFFDVLHGRAAFDGIIAPGWRLSLEWL